MSSQKYSVNQPLIETLVSWVKSGEIAIPEIQRPFVWNSTQVRDLMDSLYQGYPIGYIIAWRNPNIKLKDGSLSEGKKILIDGQQRVTALTAAIIGHKVVNKNYKKIRIKISFNPIEEKFETLTPAIEKDRKWVDDISKIFNGNLFDIVDNYLTQNPDANKEKIQNIFQDLINIPKKQIGLIELSGNLDIEKVTEIFIRINSQGVDLSQADFVMSKIAANETYGGNLLRKAIDYFSHLAIAPEFYSHIVENDKDFAKTDYFKKIAWLKNENEDLYDPTYKDVLKVAFTYKFNRGKISDLVSLLSGRNFETREYEESIAIDAYATLINGVKDFINETNFNRFLMIIKSAGFVASKLIRSVNALNFAYILYLKLRQQNYDTSLIEKYIKKWFLLSLLTGRYSSSPESRFDFDIKNISKKDFADYLNEIENAQLSDAFWNAELTQRLNTSSSTSPVFNVFIASQCYFNEKGFLSKNITVKNLIEQRGDVHHIFPRDILKKKGLTRGQYNQVANYAYTQSEINIKIGNKPIEKYLTDLKAQCGGGELIYGGITELNLLYENLKQNAIPKTIFNMTTEDYQEFLLQRRLEMSKKMRVYYETI